MQKLQKELFSCLLCWANEKKADDKGYILNKLAVELGVYLICTMSRDVIAKSARHVITFGSLQCIAKYFGDFAQLNDDPLSNRIREACNMLSDIGLIEELRQEESTSLEREKYNYGGGMVWKLVIRLKDFDYPKKSDSS